MGCQEEVYVGDNLTFSVTTHDASTGAATDADSVPTYRIYEDETGTAILTGSMAKLDDANTTGLYSEQIAATSANGFESGKSYTIYISATVNSVTGTISYNFRANTATSLTITAASVASAVAGSTITILRGDTLSAAITGLGNISSRTKLWFTVKEKYDDPDTAAIVQIVEATGLAYLNGASATAGQGSITVTDQITGALTIALVAAATATLYPRTGLYYDIQQLTPSGVQTLTSGSCAISADVTKSIS